MGFHHGYDVSLQYVYLTKRIAVGIGQPFTMRVTNAVTSSTAFSKHPLGEFSLISAYSIASHSDKSTASLTALGRIYHHIVDTFEDVILDDLSNSRNKPAAALLRVFDDQLSQWKDLWLTTAREDPSSSWNTGSLSEANI
jgi:hypothetical protein